MVITVLKNARSKSARDLARALSAALRKNVYCATVNDARTCNGDRYVINWGVSARGHNLRQRHISFSNEPLAVENCQNKIETLYSLLNEDVPCLDFLTRAEGNFRRVEQWLDEDGKIVVRHTTTGHSGAGIQIVRRGEQIPPAPLYTRYFRKHAEYRVHVAFGNVILIQQKRKRNGFDEIQAENKDLVRTHGNGWVFTVGNLSCDERNYRREISDCALAAARAVGVSHGAVDILVNHDHGIAFKVCEINSAPSLDAPSTLAAYCNAFVAQIRSMENRQ